MKSRTVWRIAACILCFICVLLLPNQAQAAEYNGFTYEIHDGEVTITGCTSKDIFEAEIPYSIDGYPVVSIGPSAFEGCPNLMEVYIPEGVKTIEPFAFYECDELFWLYLPNSLESIGKEAFFHCTSLEDLTFGKSLKTIGDGAFSYCFNLDYYLDFPEGLESIGMGAFYYCSSLETVLLPDSLKDLGSKSFAMCGRLNSIYIPDGVTRIGSQVLYQSACYYDSNNWYGDAFYIWPYLLEAKKSISGSYTTLTGITNIADGAFENCNNLTEVILPEGLQVIGANAFEDCDNLQSITIPDGVTTIGDKAFYECKSLTDVQFPDSVTNIGEDAFAETAYYENAENWENGAFYLGNNLVSCKSSVSGTLQVREGTKTIGTGAMKNLTKLTEIILPDSLTSIGDEAFYGCSGLKAVHISKAVSQIGDKAFGQCPGLESITAHSENETYLVQNNCLIRKQDNCLVLGCKASQIPTDGSVTTIGAGAFEGCEGLTEVIIPDAISYIGEGAFRDCNALTTVKLGNGVQVVGKRAFEECDMLSQLDLGQSVHTIDDYGFAHNHQLKHVDFPASLRYLGQEAFSGCTGLTSVTFQEGVVSIGVSCFAFCENLTSLHLPDSLEELKDSAFYACESIAELTLGEGLVTIGSTAFSDCEALETLVIPQSVKSIGSSAFYNCTSLKQVDLGSVETIGRSAFESCSSLPQIYIPASVKEMGKSVFSFCPAMEQMTVSPENRYYHSDGNCIIQTRSGKLLSGCKTSIIPTDGSVTVLEEYSFAGCTGLKSIVVPDTVKLICPYTFYYCSEIEEMQLPFIGGDGSYDSYIGYIFGGGPGNNAYSVPISLKRVVITGGTSVGNGAFSDCGGLQEIVLPESITSIGYDAFADCDQLEKVVIPGELEQIKSNNILDRSPNAQLYISAGNENTQALIQSNGLPCEAGGMITFMGEDGQVIDMVWYPLNGKISTPQVPEKPADDNYTYKISWEPVPGYCTGNQTIQLRYIATAIGHTWDDGVITKQPTCRKDGEKVFTCTTCNLTRTETIPKLNGHEYDAWWVDTEPTQTENGALVRYCLYCGRADRVTLPMLNETDYTYIVVIEPTEEATGIGRYIWKASDYEEFWFEVTLDKISYLPGDLDNNGIVDDEDVIYLLWHTLMPTDYEVNQNVDFDNNGIVDDEDVIYLLWHTLMPEDYPL